MEDKFDEFRRNVEREADLIRSLARAKLEFKRTAEKEGKDYTFSDNLPHNEDEYEAEKKKKPERIKNLENKFSVSSDRMQDIADNISKGYLRNISYQNLKNMFSAFVSSEQDMSNLAQEYAELTENELFTPPNCDKYLVYSSLVSQALYDEITLREEMLGGFEGKVFKE